MNCEIQEKCGGCAYGKKQYAQQLKDKTEYVEKQLKKLKQNIKVNYCIGMENPYNYRNKGKYAFKNGKMGFFEEGTHKIVYAKCAIQNEKINQVADYIFELVKKYHISIYNEDTGKGFLRHVVIRYGFFTDEVMVIFVTTDGKMYKKQEIIKDLTTKFKEIKSIIQNINVRETNAILGNKNFKMYGTDFIMDKLGELGKENINLYGNGFIEDKLGDYTFKISPLSFYQVNPIQMKKLYDTAIDFAKLTGNEVVYDLYSGIGTISLSVAKNVKKVYGIEIVKDAVIDARANARMNNITNTSFMDGKVEELLPKLCSKEKADVIFVDPPRSGLDGKTIKTILKVKPKKLVYISCNPDTLVDNLFLLEKDYDIKVVQPVDMFPFTSHVECVTVLQLKQSM